LKNPIKQLFGQTAVYGLGIVLPRVLNYLVLTPFYTRIFNQSEYGVITELYAYVVFLLVILTYGMETGYFRYASNSDRKERVYSSVLASLFATSAVFIAAVSVWSGSIGTLMGYRQHPEYIRWLAMIVGIDAFTSIPFARIRLYNRAVKYAVIRIVEVTVNILLNVFFLYYCPRHPESDFISMVYRPEIGVGYVFISNLAASLCKLVALSGEIITAFRYRLDLTMLGNVLKYSYPLLIAGLAGTVNEALDRVLLKHLLPADQSPMEQLGIYGANYKMAVLMTLFVQMFKYAAEPFFFSRSSDKNARELYADVMTYFVVAGLFIFIMVNLYMDYFILFIGENFREGAHIVPVILFANLVMGIFFSLSIWYKLTNKTLYGAVLVIGGAMITVVVNVLFIPEYGYTASAWAHLLCYSTMVVFSYLWSRKHYPIPYRIGRIITYMMLAWVIFYINKLFLQDVVRYRELIRLALLLLFVVVVYVRERNTLNSYKYGG
jgi:O-antigen/teichoic acid export membrane protein